VTEGEGFSSIKLKTGAGSVGLPSKEEEIVGSAERHHSTLPRAIVKLGLSRLWRRTPARGI